MKSKNNVNYVLALEDRTEVKNEKETRKLSIVSGINECSIGRNLFVYVFKHKRHKTFQILERCTVKQ